jgi:hypothetical protein
MTLGKLNFLDMCYDGEGTLLTRGFFNEFFSAVNGTAFDTTQAINFFIETATNEPLLTLRTKSQLIAPVMGEWGALCGVRMLEGGNEITYSARRIMDASPVGDLAYMAGVPYTIGGEDIGEKDRQMGVTLVFELSGVSWWRVFLHLNVLRVKQRLSGTPVSVGASGKIAWGYEEEGYGYEPHDQLIRLRGFNAARQRDGKVLINALLILGVDPLDIASCEDAVNRGNDELEYLLPYIRDNFTGFGKAQLSSTAEQLYVRESRHFLGEYQLTIDDVLGNRDQWDKIAIGSYPADVQPSTLNPYGTVVGSPDRYAVPFRCIVPADIENLLIVGRSASYTSMAAASARVLPLGMAVGEAAGTAAALSLRKNVGFREMSADRAVIALLQDTLIGQGAYLVDFNGVDPNGSHWAFEGVATLRRLGLMDGGYLNDYGLEDPIEKRRFQFIMNAVIKKAGYDFHYFTVDTPPSCGQILDVVASAVLLAETADETGDGFVDPAGVVPYSTPYISSGRSHDDNVDLLVEIGVIDAHLATFFADTDETPLVAETAMLLGRLYEYFKAHIIVN